MAPGEEASKRPESDPAMYYRVFDCWRFIAALLIMAYHFVFAAPYGAKEASDFLYRLNPLLDMFFMISGYFITSRYADRIGSFADFRTFLRRRVARLYPLHLIVTLFFIAVALFAWSIGAKNYPWPSDLAVIPQHLLAIHALGTTDHLALNYVSWSVSAEMFSYLLFPIIVLALRRGGTAWLAVLVATWLAALEIASAAGMFPSGHWMTADTLGAYRAFADFLTGALAARLVGAGLVPVRSHLPGLLCMTVAVVIMLLQGEARLAWVFLAASLALTAAAETARPHSTDALHPAMALTRVSFGIYLWHPVLEFFFLTVLWDRWLEGLRVIDFYVWWTLPMAATIAVALLSDRYIEPRFGRFIAGPRFVRPLSEMPAEQASAVASQRG